MPYVNVWEPHGVCTRFSGFVGAAEYVRSAEEICADPRFDELRFVIKDLLAIDGHSIDNATADPIGAIRYGARYTNPNIYLVLLTADPRLMPLAEPGPGSFLRGLYETCAFANEAAAREWLSLRPRLTRLGTTLRY